LELPWGFRNRGTVGGVRKKNKIMCGKREDGRKGSKPTLLEGKKRYKKNAKIHAGPKK